jgi:lipoprotein-releasing system permease protein
MYKLFLALRYLRKRIIAYFAVAAVTLCVAMLVIVISVMNGFLDKIEQAAKGLFGDIVITTGQQWGMADYDAFIERIETMDPVQAASPYIYCYAALRLKPYPEQAGIEQDLPGDHPARRRRLRNYREGIQAVGIRLPERAEVSDFENGLFVQTGDPQPTWDPEVERMIQSNLDHQQWTLEQLKQVRSEIARFRDEVDTSNMDEQTRRELERMLTERNQLEAALDFHEVVIPRLRRLQQSGLQQIVRYIEGNPAHIQAVFAGQLAVGQLLAGAVTGPSWATAPAAEGIVDPLPLEDIQLELLHLKPWRPKQERAILGAILPGLSARTRDGDVVQYWVPGRKALLYVLPLQEMTGATPTPESAELTVVDISRTGVHNIDSSTIYVPFDLLQRLNRMDYPQKRCSQIHVKVSGATDERSLLRIAAAIQAEWNEFARTHPRPPQEGMVQARTWRQVQAGLIEPIQSQRTLVVVMFGIISTVAVFLIFVIFYMVVLQKTKDIGILKSVGASAPGVAGIFLLYGAVIGLIGAILGTILGAWFVHEINPIHDWVGEHFGLTVWRMETFMFDTIPSEVDWGATIWILLGSIAAGLVGAMIPAIRAATMQPVEALRYE